jgi:hypothetical protein
MVTMIAIRFAPTDFIAPTHMSVARSASVSLNPGG